MSPVGVARIVTGAFALPDPTFAQSEATRFNSTTDAVPGSA